MSSQQNSSMIYSIISTQKFRPFNTQNHPIPQSPSNPFGHPIASNATSKTSKQQTKLPIGANNPTSTSRHHHRKKKRRTTGIVTPESANVPDNSYSKSFSNCKSFQNGLISPPYQCKGLLPKPFVMLNKFFQNGLILHLCPSRGPLLGHIFFCNFPAPSSLDREMARDVRLLNKM